jgi:hypothetical protein
VLARRWRQHLMLGSNTEEEEEHGEKEAGEEHD